MRENFPFDNIGGTPRPKETQRRLMPVFFRPKMAYFPVCFESAAQYGYWLEAAKTAQSEIGGSGVCADCTPEYQRQMIGERRCAYPAVRFDVDKDGFIRGYRPHARHEWRSGKAVEEV